MQSAGSITGASMQQGLQTGSQPHLQDSIFGCPAIDCDVHISVPSTATLMPYLDAYWYDHFALRGIDRTSFTLTGDAPNAPFAARADWRPQTGRPGSDTGMLTSMLEDFKSSAAIANCIFGGVALHSEDMAAVMCKAVNDWVADKWLRADPRLFASVLVPLNSPQLAVEEIERRAGDPRFVQVLMFAMGRDLLGKRSHWPIYEAAERHGFAIAVHAGSLYHHPPMTGYGSFAYEDYVAQSFSFENQLVSLVAEGVFQKFAKLKFVFAESGVTWAPPALWRFDKTWHGVRADIPWVKTLPSDIVSERVRFTLQPFDAPHERRGELIDLWCEQMKSDEMLLFSTDFPHWHFEGHDALAPDISSHRKSAILFENALATYPRMKAALLAAREAA